METKIIAVDAGNYDLKFWDGTGEPKAIRSLKFQLPTGRKPLLSNNLNPLLELNGKRYHYGHRAYDYRKQEHTVEGEKAHSVLPNVLACVEPLDSEFILHVHTSHPRPEQFESEIQKQLLGSWRYTRNGKKAIAHIESVSVEPEGLGAWRHGKQKGLIPESGLSIVIDLGGGTWLSHLINEDGEILDSSVSERGGAYSLASDISFDQRLRNALGDQPQPGVIMDGFSQSHCYAGNPSVSWISYLDEYRKPWIQGILGKVKNQYQQYLPRVQRFLITGGSAHLISSQLTGMPGFVMTNEPRFDNVRGLLPSAKVLAVAVAA